MESKFENNTLTIFLEDRIDSNNADSVGAQIDEIRNANPDGSLVLDFEKMNYISSAGLRQILRLKKKEKDFKLVNVSSELYEIFDMTGFSEMMTIEKAYRHLSVDGCEVIGEGSNGIVYRINPDTIVKVYKNSDALDDIKRERELARTALVMGVNTAIPYDVVKVGDKYGSVFELLSAKSITKWIMENKENLSNADQYIKVFADLLKEIHDTPVKPGVLPDAKQRTIDYCNFLKGKIGDDTYNKLSKMLEEVPECTNMIHGDYHTNNVHYANDEPILIDMDTLATGNPVFEFSNFYLAYKGFGDVDHTRVEQFLKIDWDIADYIYNKTFEFYFEGQPAEYIEQVKLKAQAVGYTRLLRRTLRREPENTALIENCQTKLANAVKLVDTLAI